MKLSELKLEGFEYDPNTSGNCGEVYFNHVSNPDDEFVCFIPDMDKDDRIIVTISKSCQYVYVSAFAGNEIDPDFIAASIATLKKKYLDD